MSTLIRAAGPRYRLLPHVVAAGRKKAAADSLVLETRALEGLGLESGSFLICLIILKVRREVFVATNHVTSESNDYGTSLCYREATGG